jgi:hypothetical protein
MLTPIGTFLTGLVTGAEASIVLPVIALAFIIGGLTWALSNHDHGRAKVIGGLIGGAIALMAQPIAVALQGGVPH